MMNRQINDSYLHKLFNIKDAQKVLHAPPPIYLSSILAYIIAHYNGNHQEMLALKKKTRGDTLPVDWMNKWYSKSQEFLAPKYRSQIKQEIFKQDKTMNTKDIKNKKQKTNESNIK